MITKNNLHLFPRLLRKQFYKKWNVILLRFLGAKIGNGCLMYNYINIKISPKSFVKIGNNVVIKSGDGYNALARNIQASLCIEQGAKLIIGNHVGLSSPCILASKGIYIGNNCIIGADCLLLDTDSHNINYLLRRDWINDAPTSSKSEIYIEDDVMIGARCIILKGVRIGARTVIGAGSVVTKSLPADCIAAGNPCKIIKYNK